MVDVSQRRCGASAKRKKCSSWWWAEGGHFDEACMGVLGGVEGVELDDVVVGHDV